MSAPKPNPEPRRPTGTFRTFVRFLRFGTECRCMHPCYFTSNSSMHFETALTATYVAKRSGGMQQPELAALCKLLERGENSLGQVVLRVIAGCSNSFHFSSQLHRVKHQQLVFGSTWSRAGQRFSDIIGYRRSVYATSVHFQDSGSTHKWKKLVLKINSASFIRCMFSEHEYAAQMEINDDFNTSCVCLTEQVEWCT